MLVGVGGLFLLPTESTTGENSETISKDVIQEQKVIKLAIATKDLPAGAILKEDDYQINELKVDETSPLVNEDISDFLVKGDADLSGFLLFDKAINGRFLAKSSLISPTDERFLFYTVGKGEVVYRVYIHLQNQFILDTLKSGDVVGLFAQQKDLKGSSDEQLRFDPILQNLEVVKIDRFSEEKSAEFKDYAGYVSVRMKANQVKDIFSLTKNRSLLVLPQEKMIEHEILNKRGLSVRSLRGQKGN